MTIVAMPIHTNGLVEKLGLVVGVEADEPMDSTELGDVRLLLDIVLLEIRVAWVILRKPKDRCKRFS